MSDSGRDRFKVRRNNIIPEDMLERILFVAMVFLFVPALYIQITRPHSILPSILFLFVFACIWGNVLRRRYLASRKS